MKYIKESSISYNEFKALYDKYNDEVTTSSNLLNAFDWRDEKVRSSQEYVIAKSDYDKKFATLQQFNKSSDNAFQRQYRKERRTWRN
jgi:hypothetical protein